MPYLLHIETATRNCSVAVSENDRILSLKEIADTGYSHAEKLHIFIGEALKEAEIEFSDLSAIAVSKGPGSYTGLRIGVSSAKGLCYALAIPLLAIDTLAILAAKIKVESGLIIPMLDARRMEVYSAVFTPDLEKIGDTKAEILTVDSYQDAAQMIHIAGDCQEKCKTVLISECFVFHADAVFPSASEMATSAYAKYIANDFEDMAYFEPFYLKDFMAQKTL